MTKKFIDLIRRLFIVLKNEGIKSVLLKIKNKIGRKFFQPVELPLIQNTDTNYYKDIYLSYLSTSQNEITHDFRKFSENIPTDIKQIPKLIAFYLPQYHPIPENDLWWERGFTEWSNVAKAVPEFVGHYQPHLPGELGYYDLRVPEVQKRQVELAMNYGIYGFCFYYYWFAGKILLEKPLNQFTENESIDFPFCLCWANENWTRRWDGLENEILIEQHHSEESDFAFINSIKKYLLNKRYIRILDRPILIVYRISLLPNPLETSRRWRNYCRENNIGEIYLIAVQSSGEFDPKSIGFDAAMEFPPHGLPILTQIQTDLKIVNPNFKGAIYEYSHAAAGMMQKIPPKYQLFKTVMTSWDNTARMQTNPLIFHNCTPKYYQSWLTSAMEYSLEFSPEGGKFVFINAWNEWAEGTHLEPDRRYGFAYLNATKLALEKMERYVSPTGNLPKIEGILAGFKKRNDTLIILHIFYLDLWEEINTYLENLEQKFDLIISVPNSFEFPLDLIKSKYPEVKVFRCINRGRDINPFIKILSEIKHYNYKYICKIHTKRSSHRTDGNLWRKEILEELLGSKNNIKQIKLKLDRPEIGIIGPKDNLISTESYIGGNQQLVCELAEKLNIIYWDEPFNFVAGSMFWFKPEAILSIIKLSLNDDDFPTESGQIDGTLAHALERIIGLIAQKQGYKIIQTGTFSEAPNLNYQFAKAKNEFDI
jgi:lipopolysaccharide biosynthesis protein